MRFCIDSSILGSTKHFVYDDGYTWSASVPRDSWHLTGDLKDSPTSKCLDTLLKLVHHTTASLPAKYTTAMSSLVTGSVSIPWQHVVPRVTYREYFNNLVSGTSSIFPRLPFAYYETAWVAGSRVLGALKPAKVDPDKWRSASEGPSPAVESFRPGKTGYTAPVVYDRFATRTGRLTITSGPNILVLKKENKAMLRSAFPDGKVVSLDFAALEARIVLAEAGKWSTSLDLYSDIAQQQFGGSVSRDTVKTAVLSELYGASRGALGLRLGIHGDRLDAFIGSVRRHFEVPALRKRLKTEADSSGRILNRFGRPLFFDGVQDNLLVNTYAQSSGVDVALLGFDSILKTMGTDGVRPLFVLHDAIILDVRGDRMKDVEACTSVSVPTYDQPFPLKLESIS